MRATSHGFLNDFLRISGALAFLAMVLLSGGNAHAATAANPTARYLNPVCRGDCDEQAAKAECESELEIAKSDPDVQATAQNVICANRAPPNSNPKYYFGFPGAVAGAIHQGYFNYYQNDFPYGDGYQPNPGLACPLVPGAVPDLGQCFGDPVNAATGNKFETEVQYIGNGIFPISLSLYYNSSRMIAFAPDRQKIFGRNRTHSYLRWVDHYVGATGEFAQVVRPDGKSFRFTKTAGQWVPERPTYGQLIPVLDAGSTVIGWEYLDKIDGKEAFDADGRLLALYSPEGYVHTLTYDAQGRISTIVDPQGRTLNFQYGANGLVSQILFPDGTSRGYLYTPGRDLEYVQHSGATQTRYLYDETAYVQAYTPAGSLTGEIDESGQRYSTTTYSKSLYYSNARATSTTMGGGVDTESAVYNFHPNNQHYVLDATVSLATGATRQIVFAKVKDVALPTSVTTSCSGCVTQTANLTYDANGMTDLITVNGVQTDHDYNTRGLEIQRIDAANDTTGKKRTIQTDWHGTFRSPIERRTLDSTGALKAKTNWTYNARNQVLTTTVTDPATSATRTTTTTYCDGADVTAGTCPFVGLVKSTDGARTDVTDTMAYAYRQVDDSACVTAPTTCAYRKGDLWKVTNALGQTVETLAYDGAGRPLSMIDANGVRTDYEYHPRGWLTGRKVRGTNNASEADDQITTIEYWPTGLVKKVTQPDGAFTSYTYDAAHRLTGIADNAGNSITYTLNAAGERTKEDTKDPSGTLTATLSRAYNALGQLQTVTDAYSRNTGFTYDANGNLDLTNDALSRRTDNDYDPLSRLTRTLQDSLGINAQTTFAYDALGNLVQVNDPKGLNTIYTYNGFSDLTQLVSPDTGTTVYTYDSAGNRATQKDARNKTATYGYDALNRLTTVTYAATSLNTTYLYDVSQTNCAAGETFGVGRLTRMTDSSGSTVYCYDRFGQLVRRVQTINSKAHTLRWVYLTNGRLQKMIYPDNTEVDYVYDAQGRVTEIGYTRSGGTRQVVLTGATYYAFGPVNRWTYGNGRIMERGLNLNYQPGFVEVQGPGGIDLGYEFDEVGNLKRLRTADQAEPPLRVYGYDGLNRLTQSQNGSTSAVLESYTYDKTGNRTAKTVNGTGTTYTYPATNHRLSNVAGVARTFDTNGNTRAVGGTAKQFTYGDHNRMTLVKANGTTTMNYGYNGRGERVRKWIGTSNTYSQYDEAGRWLGDYANAGASAPLQQVIWLGDLPVGLITGAGTGQKLHYIEPDALGTPRVVVDPARGAQGTAVWTWPLTGEAFGDAAPNQDPDGDATAFVFDMRFPGQRFDAATGLNYNYFRDYEAATGRYVESDPIGLGGGISLYAYVAGDPLAVADPRGLMGYGTRGSTGWHLNNKCAPTPRMKACLEKILGKDPGGVRVHDNSLFAAMHGGASATTRENNIYVKGSCSSFFANPYVVLEEYYHVLQQWNVPGRLTVIYYLVDNYSDGGYDKNRWEKEAKKLLLIVPVNWKSV